MPSPLGPLLLWLVKRDSHQIVDDQGKEALNSNLSAFLYAVGIFAVGFVFSFVIFGLGALLFVSIFFAVAIARTCRHRRRARLAWRALPLPADDPVRRLRARPRSSTPGKRARVR